MGLKQVHCEAVFELTPEVPTDEDIQITNLFHSEGIFPALNTENTC